MRSHVAISQSMSGCAGPVAEVVLTERGIPHLTRDPPTFRASRPGGQFWAQARRARADSLTLQLACYVAECSVMDQNAAAYTSVALPVHALSAQFVCTKKGKNVAPFAAIP